MSTSVLGLDVAQRGLSYYAVPLAFVVAFVPHSYAVLRSGKKYDPAYPRQTLDKVMADESMDKITKLRIRRAKAAVENNFETLGFYASAVVAATAAGADPVLTNALAFGVVGLKALHAFVYVILQDNRAFATMRSLVWIATQLGTIALYVLAGRAASD